MAALLARIGAALSATAGLTLAAGALVLAGAVAAGQRRRVRDAVVLKTVGATRAQIRRAFLVEFGLLGVTAGVIAAAAGTAAAWAVVRFVMRADWGLPPAPWPRRCGPAPSDARLRLCRHGAGAARAGRAAAAQRIGAGGRNGG